MKAEKLLAKGLVERIGLDDGIHTWYRPGGEDHKDIEPIPDHARAIEMVLAALTDPADGVIGSMAEVNAVGHRVVHAGEEYSGSVVITDDVIRALYDCVPLAPLHNPANITGIEAARKVMPEVPMVGVFDTAFHQTMPDRAYIYPIPYYLYEDHKIRRYGFHGTSHRYVSLRAAQILERDLRDLNFISCHLGNGASVAAVQGGRSIDTSMGLTPLEGLMMGTRSGDIDPALVGFLARRLDITLPEVEKILNKESGMLGISGISSDLRDVEREYANGNDRARLALEVYGYHIRKYIGAYAVALGRVDAILFTAGVGEHASLCARMGLRGPRGDRRRARSVQERHAPRRGDHLQDELAREDHDRAHERGTDDRAGYPRPRAAVGTAARPRHRPWQRRRGAGRSVRPRRSATSGRNGRRRA